MAPTKEKDKASKTRIPSAQKRDRLSEERHMRNRSVKSSISTVLKKYETAPAQENLSDVFSLLDKAVKKGVLKSNKVNRTKARLAKKIR